MAAQAAKTTNTTDDVTELKAEIARLRKEISDLAKHVSEVGDLSAKAARKAATSKAEELKAKGEETYDELRATALGYEKQLTDAVHEKPLTSLAMAAGVGYFLALLSRR